MDGIFPSLSFTTGSINCLVDFLVLVSIVLGVPTVKRESQSYLLPTLASLIDSMTDEEKSISLIVVFIAEVIAELNTD